MELAGRVGEDDLLRHDGHRGACGDLGAEGVEIATDGRDDAGAAQDRAAGLSIPGGRSEQDNPPLPRAAYPPAELSPSAQAHRYPRRTQRLAGGTRLRHACLSSADGAAGLARCAGPSLLPSRRHQRLWLFAPLDARRLRSESFVQRSHERKRPWRPLDRAVDAERQPSTRDEYAVHLPQRRGPIGAELHD